MHTCIIYILYIESSGVGCDSNTSRLSTTDTDLYMALLHCVDLQER